MSLDEAAARGELDGLAFEYVAGEGACRVGRELDGRRLASLEEVYALLPAFGANPACEHGHGCSCTALPVSVTAE